MIDDIIWAERGMEVDVVHDGRHGLPDVAMARESIPYIVVLPEHQIAFFTYTWVSKDSLAGAALAVFGPGVGGQPIQQRLVDRPVDADMDFDDWRIEGFEMRQDLKFGSAHVRWETPEATVEFQFEAVHPPYAYGSDSRGCPAYCATDRVEQAGRVKGRLRIGDRTIPFDATGHRDHSWGTRDWVPFQHYEWFVGQVSDEIAIHFWRFNALGKEHLRGYVFKEGVMSRIASLELNVSYDGQYWQTSYTAHIVDEAGRFTRIETEVFGHYTLKPVENCSLNESGGRSIIDGREGVAWMECCWPTDYLDHIRVHGPY